MLKAVYPGTFDPITLGHENLIRRASTLFDHVLVAIADSDQKNPWFTANERVDLARAVLHDIPNVEVQSFSGLLMDFVRAQHAKVIVRGLRAVSDFEYEFKMAATNRTLCPFVETVFLTPSERFMFVSSTVVRELAHYGADLSEFLQPSVIEAIQLRRVERSKE
ncbi:MAG: pantetheine-phosphate adenylyltransferase [Pseudomonadota bacterium]